MIKLLFFAQLEDFAQTDAFELEHTAGMTPRSVVQSLVGQLPKALTDALIHDVAMVAANEVMITWDDELSDGDVVAFLPPFSGG